MAKSHSSKNSRAGRSYAQEIVTLLRVALSAALLIAAYSVNAASLVSMLMLIAAALICGFDIVLAAVDKIIKKRDYLNDQLLVCLCAIACFCIGCYTETIVMLVVYQLGRTCLNFVIRKTKLGFYGAVSPEDREGSLRLRSILNSPGSLKNSVFDKYMPYLELFSKAAFIVGILFAAAVPLITDMTYVMSIRRGSMLIIAAVPISALAALPMYSLAGLSRAAEYGVYIKNTASLENTGDLASVIYDKADVFTDGTPKLVSVNSPILDNESFLQLAAYTAYSSEQRFAAPIVSAYSGDIITSYISDFKDIPGCGMEISLHGRSVLLGTGELFDAKGISIPDTERKSGYILYLAIGGRYAGSLTLKEKLNPYAESVISDFAALGGIKSVLLTEDGRDVSERLAKALNVDELHYECGFTEKADIIQKCKDQLAPDEKLMYISAENLEYHTAADIDAKVGTEFENADMLMSNVGIFGLPVAYTASHMVKRLSSENLVFTAVIKFVLVVLALTGSATLWFIVLLDFAASVFGVLNVVRMPSADTLREDSED
ncbi:MAG: HAD family hydrolase [Oscillospiraceae bacterium]|jgi:Cd2+/Zn2+-exporting ATPase|nr:HAD family hydrolase [Oscillospiraceae bacterium]